MLVLTRRVDQSVLVNDVVVVTVAEVASAYVELSVATIEGGVLSTLRMKKNQSAFVGCGVRVVVVESTSEKVRLGFEYPPGVSIIRSDEP